VVLITKNGPAEASRAQWIASGKSGRAGVNARSHADLARSSTSAPALQRSMEDWHVPVLSRRFRIASWQTARVNAHGRNGTTGTAVRLPVEVDGRLASELFSLLQLMEGPVMALVTNCKSALRASAPWTAKSVTGLLGGPAVTLVVKAKSVVHDR